MKTYIAVVHKDTDSAFGISDTAAAGRNLTRSAFIAEAARNEIQRTHGAEHFSQSNSHYFQGP